MKREALFKSNRQANEQNISFATARVDCWILHILAEFAPKEGIAPWPRCLRWFRISEAKESGRSAAW